MIVARYGQTLTDSNPHSGRPIVLKRVSPSDLKTVEASRICLIKPSALGDIIQTLPLLPVLRERFPEAKVSWVVARQLHGMLEGHPDLDQIIDFDRGSSWSGWRQLLGTLKRQEFDLVLDLQGLLRTGVMTAATGATTRIGLETSREGSGLVCNCIVPDTGRLVPAHVRYWRVADALGMGDVRRETRLPIAPKDRDWATQRLNNLRTPVLAVQPGARWVTKRWPVERFAVVAAKATRHFGASVVIVGSKDEWPAAAQLESLLRRFCPAADIANLAGATTLKQLAAVLSGADVLLTNDSGPMHLAAALGTPVVGVFTCTCPIRSGPSGDKHEFVTTNVPCAASYKKRCPYKGPGHMACMEELETDRVWDGLLRLMEKRRARGNVDRAKRGDSTYTPRTTPGRTAAG